MDYKDIIRNMNSGEFKNVYLFYGREFYLLENVIKTCRKSLNESMRAGTIKVSEKSESIWMIILSLLTPFGLLIIFFIFCTVDI